MQKAVTIMLVFFTITKSFAQFETAKQIYKSPELPLFVDKAKSIAILPFKVSISYKRMPKGVSVEQIKENEADESTQMQNGMYTYLLRKADDFTVTFQDVERTNALLRKAGLFNSFDEVTSDSLCLILGVDGVIKSSWNYSKTGSEAGAIASTLLLGVAKGTGSGQLVMQISRAKDGQLMWRMSKEMNEGAFSSASQLMERMMRKVGRVFPFEK